MLFISNQFLHMKNVKKDLEGFIFNVYPVYQPDSKIPLNRFTSFFRNVEQNELRTALLSLKEERKVDLNEGLNQEVIILPALYQ